jgi:hypothetical protein
MNPGFIKRVFDPPVFPVLTIIVDTTIM